jgi:hypothetical protein
MRLTRWQYEEILTRQAARSRESGQPVPEDAVDRESELHSAILAWCNQQVPQPAVKHDRMDKASRSTPGSPDFIIFWRGRVIIPECKTRDGKVSPAQAIWHHLAKANGFTVSIVRSMSDFLAIVNRKEP